jgi:hypothetical protein
MIEQRQNWPLLVVRNTVFIAPIIMIVQIVLFAPAVVGH